MINREQLRIGRRSVEMTQVSLAKASGISAATINAIENGFAFRSTTMHALQEVLKAKGAVFGPDGGVAVRMDWSLNGGRPSSKRIREGTLAILNASRKARGQCPLVDMEGA